MDQHRARNLQSVTSASQEEGPFFSTAVDLLAVAGFDGQLRRVNGALAHLLGYEVDELAGVSYKTLFDSDALGAIDEVLDRMRTTGEPTAAFEIRLRCKDGTYRWVRGSARPDLEQQVVYVTAKDIDERRVVEEALREAEEHFRLAFEHAPVGMAIVNLEGIFEQANTAVCRIMGYSEKELIGSHVDLLELADDPLILTGPSIELLDGERDLFRGEFPMRRADGERLWVDLSISLAHDAQGAPRSFLAQLIDVTERRKVNAELQLRAELEEAIAEISTRMICVDAASLEHEIRDALGRLGTRLGADRAYVLRHNRHPDERQLVEWSRPGAEVPARDLDALPSTMGEAWDELLLRGEVVQLSSADVADNPGGGLARSVLEARGIRSLLVVPLRTRRRFSGFIGLVSVDDARTFSEDAVALLRLAGESFMNSFDRADADAALTDASNELERRNDELERSNEELERFAFAAAHDLKAPLSRIEMALQVLGAADLGADQRQMLDVARRGGLRMRQLIEDLLIYGTVGSGLGQPEPVNLDAVVRAVAADLSGTIAAVGATVEIDELPTVQGHRSLLGQLFQNLLANALKFVRPGIAPTVRVEAERSPHGWILSVADNGRGIAVDKRQEVFAMFTRLDPNDTQPGSGIGLATCLKVVHSHGGRIWVEDNPGGGSRFRISLPG